MASRLGKAYKKRDGVKAPCIVAEDISAEYKAKRWYGFESWETFAEAYAGLQHRHLYEVIDPAKPARLLLDIDGNSAAGSFNMDLLVSCVCLELAEHDIQTTPTDVVVLEASSASKFSYHVIVPDVVTDSWVDQTPFWQAVCEKYVSHIRDSASADAARECFDLSVYNRFRCMRLMGSSKKKEPQRVLKLDPRFRQATLLDTIVTNAPSSAAVLDVRDEGPQPKKAKTGDSAAATRVVLPRPAGFMKRLAELIVQSTGIPENRFTICLNRGSTFSVRHTPQTRWKCPHGLEYTAEDNNAEVYHNDDQTVVWRCFGDCTKTSVIGSLSTQDASVFKVTPCVYSWAKEFDHFEGYCEPRMRKLPVEGHKLCLVQAGCGSGKSHQTREFVKRLGADTSIVTISNRISLAVDQMSILRDLGFKHYKDKSIKWQDAPARLVIQLESMHKVRKQPKVLILDEAASLMAQCVSTETHKNRLVTNFQRLKALASHADHVIALDAFVDEQLAKWLRELVGPGRCAFVHNIYQKPRVLQMHQPVHFLNEFKAQLAANKRIIVCSNTRSLIEDLVIPHMAEVGLRHTVKPTEEDASLTGDYLYHNGNDPTDDWALANVNKFWAQQKVVLYTPKVQTGVNFSVEGHFDVVFVYGLGSPFTACARDVHQMIARVRNPVTNVIHCCVETKGQPAGPTTYTGMEAYIKSANAMNDALVASIATTTTFDLKRCEHVYCTDSQLVRTYINSKVEHNLSAQNFKREFLKLARAQRWTVVDPPNVPVSDEELEALDDAKSAGRQARVRAEIALFDRVEPADDIIVEQSERGQALDLAEKTALKKRRYLEMFKDIAPPLWRTGEAYTKIAPRVKSILNVASLQRQTDQERLKNDVQSDYTLIDEDDASKGYAVRRRARFKMSRAAQQSKVRQILNDMGIDLATNARPEIGQATIINTASSMLPIEGDLRAFFGLRSSQSRPPEPEADVEDQADETLRQSVDLINAILLPTIGATLRGRRRRVGPRSENQREHFYTLQFKPIIEGHGSDQLAEHMFPLITSTPTAEQAVEQIISMIRVQH